MTDYRAVMDQVLKGWSVRQICSSLQCSHTTVQKPTMRWWNTTSQPVSNFVGLRIMSWWTEGVRFFVRGGVFYK